MKRRGGGGDGSRDGQGEVCDSKCMTFSWNISHGKVPRSQNETIESTCLTLAVPTTMFIRRLPFSRWYQLSARACESWSHAEFKTRCPFTSSLTVTLIKTAFPAEFWTAMGQCRVASEVEDAWLLVHCLTEAVMQRSRSTFFSPVIFKKSQQVIFRDRERQGPKEI